MFLSVTSRLLRQSLLCPVGLRYFSDDHLQTPPGFVVTEVKIPISTGFIAGKLWNAEDVEETTSTPNVTNGHGKEIPPILCVHGWIDNAGSFDPLLPLVLKPKMTAFAMDLPGHGFSSHTAPVSYDSHMEGLLAIHRVMQHFGWNKVTLMGHSLGSIICFIFTGCFPEFIHRYIALDNIHPIPKEYPRSIQRTIRTIFEVERKLLRSQPTYTPEQILNKMLEGRQGTITELGCRILLKRGAVPIASDPSKYRFSHDIRTTIPTGLGRFSMEQIEQIGRSVRCPVCVIKGEPGNDYEPRQNFLKMVDILRLSAERLEFHLIPGTHHFHLNDPNIVAPIISRFLNS